MPIIKHNPRILFATDLHLSAIPPGRRVDDYETAILDKVRYWCELCHKYDAIGVCGGDVFHHKNPRSPGNSLSLISKTITEFSKFPLGKVFGCIGNHDLSWDRWDSIPTQPIGVLIAAGVYHNIVGDPLVIEPIAKSSRLTPCSVLVDSYKYTEDNDILVAEILANKVDSEIRKGYVRIGLLHAYGNYESTGGIGYNPIPFKDLDDSDYDYFWWGHDHRFMPGDGGCDSSERGLKRTHMRIGSLSRAALDIDDQDRKVYLLDWEHIGMGNDRWGLEEVPSKPFRTIFSAASKGVESMKKNDQVASFFEDMEKSVTELDSNDPKTVLTSLCPENEQDVLKVALDMCDLS